MTDDELKELVKESGISLASRVHFLFDDYGNVQLCMFNKEQKPLFVNCIFSHVEKIDHNNPKKIVTYCSKKFMVTKYKDEYNNSLEHWNKWDETQKFKWLVETHRN